MFCKLCTNPFCSGSVIVIPRAHLEREAGAEAGGAAEPQVAEQRPAEVRQTVDDPVRIPLLAAAMTARDEIIIQLSFAVGQASTGSRWDACSWLRRALHAGTVGLAQRSLLER